MGLYLPPELRWLGWVAGTSWPDGDEDGMWAISDDWKAAATALTDQEPLVLKAKQDTEQAYPAGEGADSMGAHFDQLIDGDHSVKALAETLHAVYESTFDMGTQLQATKITIIASLAWLAMEIAWAWLFPPTAPAAEAAGVATTRSFLKVVEDYIQNAIERLAGDLGASTMKNRYFWKELVTGGKLIAPSAKGIGVYAVKAVEGAAMSAAMDGAVQLGQIAAGKRHGFDWKEFGVSIGASAAGSIPGREVARYAGNGIDKLFGNELKKMNIPLGSWTYPAGSVLRGGAIGVVSGATSTLFGNMVVAAAYGPGAFGSPAGWVGGMARGGIVGAARGTFVKSTPATGDDIRLPAWMKTDNFSTSNKVSRTSRPTGAAPAMRGGGLEDTGTGGGQRNTGGGQETQVAPASVNGNRAGETSLDDTSSVNGSSRGGTSLSDPSSVNGSSRGGTFLSDPSSVNGGSRSSGTFSDGSSANTGGRGGGTFLDDASSVNGGNRAGGTFLDDASSVNGGNRGGGTFLDDASSVNGGNRGVSYLNHAGGGADETPPAPVRPIEEPTAGRTGEPPNSFQSSVDGGWTPPARTGGAEEGLQSNPPATVRPGGNEVAQGDSSTTGIRSGVAGQQSPGSVRSGTDGESSTGIVAGGGRTGDPQRSFLNMDDSSSEAGSSVRGSAGGQGTVGGGRAGGLEEQGPQGVAGGGRTGQPQRSFLNMDDSSDEGSVRGSAGGGVRTGAGEEAPGGAPRDPGGTEGETAGPRRGAGPERPEQYLGKATEMKAKTRPKRVPEWVPLPGPFEAPTAPTAADWLDGASGPDGVSGATGPDTGPGATGSGASGPDGNPSGTNPTGTNPTGTNPTGTNPTGTNPTGTNPTGTNPTGTDPTGTDPTGTDPGGTEPGTENNVRAGISTVDVPFNLGGNG